MAGSSRNGTTKNLRAAVHRSKATSTDGILERLFTFAFKGLVYPQIWEDPEIDMQALALEPGARMIAIASGGCNVMSYLTVAPEKIIAVDLNRAHVALTLLKISAAQNLPSHGSFYRFFGEADEKANVAAYQRFIQPRLDETARQYWEGRDVFHRRRITLFSRDLYRHGLLGYFIGAGHFVAKLYGIDPKRFMNAGSLDEQRSFFDNALAPLFDKRLVRWATSKKVSLYGLGIPPAQYEALASAGNGSMAEVLKQRLEKLACDFSLSDNYFAWQAFGRSYAGAETGPLPPYLKKENFELIRDMADRVSVVNRSFTEELEEQREESLDAYVLLDAQDWMTDAQLNDLWSGITRTAKSGARVIFRTAADPSLLPGRVAQDILDRWSYREGESLAFGKQDRSSIYGGFHLYTFDG
ncbi:MAG: DUF3419 family protein [Stappiaceae bacterium]